MTFFRLLSRSRLRLRFALLALLFLALTAATSHAVYTGLAAQRETVPLGQARTIPNTDVNPYGANFFLNREVEPWKQDKTLHMAAEAGIGWVKLHFPWEDIEPRRKGEFIHPATGTDSWAKYDHIVDLCEKYGLRIVARLDRPPAWARQDNTYQQAPPDDYADYGDFVYEFVKRYEGRIDYIQIWNEPNIFPEWGNRPVSPEEYVQLLKVAYRRAKEANPNVYVLSAPLAFTLGEPHPEPGRWRSMNDLDYLEAMYRAGAKDYFDIFSVNAFGMGRPPEDPPDPNVLNLQRVLLQRKIMERHGDANKAVWFNEYGWNAAPDHFDKEQLIWGRVSEREQVEYTLRGIQMAREEWPWAGVFMIWYFRQVGHIPINSAEYYFRMVEPDFTPRPLYFAVQDVAHTPQEVGPGVYQQTHPAVQTYGDWHNVIDPNARSGSYIRSDTPGDSINFVFYGTAVDLITHRCPESGRLLVSLNGQPVPGLPVDHQGQSYVDLYSPSIQTQARVPLVRGAAPRRNTLRITIAEEVSAGATGRECTLDAFEVVEEERPPFPVAPLVAGLVGMSLNGWLIWRTAVRVRRTVRAP